MATSRILFTPIDNIDFENNKVINESYIHRKEYDSYNDTFKMKYKGGDERTDTLINVSLYHDVVTIDGVPCKILHMLTK